MLSSRVPNSVCWNITSRCNDKCKFCYREEHLEELPFDKQKAVIHNIAQADIKKLTFAGGEPLLVQNIKLLIDYAKEEGLITSLTTNALKLDNDDTLLMFLLKHLDWLTFSLDAESDSLQSEMGRNAIHASRVIHILERIKEIPGRNCRIKVNTVVSKINADEVEHVGEVIRKYDVDRWKLFQFTPVRGSAKRNREMYDISDADYQGIVNGMVKEFTNDRTKVCASDSKGIEMSYFVVFSNGDIRVSTQGEEKKL